MPVRPLFLVIPLLLLGCAAQPHAAQPAGEPTDAAVPALLNLPRWTPGVPQAVRPDAALARRAPLVVDRDWRPAPSSGDAVRRTLEATRLPSLAFRSEPSLRAVCRSICGYAGVNVYVDEDAEDALLGSGSTIDVVRSSSISAASALDLVTELAGDDVAWTTRFGAVLVTTPDKARGPARRSVFEVSDLSTALPSYAARELDLSLFGGLTQAEDVGRLEREPRFSESLLEDLIRSTIDPDSWDEPGNSITIRGGKLIVRHD